MPVDFRQNKVKSHEIFQSGKIMVMHFAYLGNVIYYPESNFMKQIALTPFSAIFWTAKNRGIILVLLEGLRRKFLQHRADQKAKESPAEKMPWESLDGKPQEEKHMIELTGYWAERLKKNSMEEKELARATRLYLKKDEMAGRYPEISFKVLEFMPNLKELKIHLDNVVDWSYLTSLTSLTKLTISRKEIDTTFVGYLEQMPKLKELHLTGGAIVSDFDGLAANKSIKILILSGAPGFTSDNIQKFTHLTQLMVDKNQDDLTDGIGQLVKLTKLELKNTPVESLNFLRNIKNLSEFKLERKVQDENIADILSGLKKLKRLEYPLSDLSVVKACPKLISVCVDGNGYENMDAIQNTEIVSVTVIDAASEDIAEGIIAEAKKYREITSYGYNMPWRTPGK